MLNEVLNEDKKLREKAKDFGIFIVSYELGSARMMKYGGREIIYYSHIKDFNNIVFDKFKERSIIVPLEAKCDEIIDRLLNR